MLIIGNGRVLTRGERHRIVEGGAVAADGDAIAAVGGTEELRARYPGAEFIDARGRVVMPGLINAHGHIYSAFARGLGIRGHSPKNFLDILEGQWWKMDRRMTLEDTRLSAAATYLDCIRNGVTTLFDHHASYGSVEGSLFAVAEAAEELGVRTCLCYEVSDRDGEAKMRAAAKENADFIAHCKRKKSSRLAAMTGLHASFTLSDKSLALCREMTPDDVGFHIHVAEGMTDVYDSLKKYGVRPVNRLHAAGILGERSIAGHCIHVDGGEMEILRETGTAVVHNPESNMSNAVGCPPTMEMMRRGVLMGLGTDGYTGDMFESMKAASCLHRHHLADPQAAWAEVPEMLFRGNAAIGARHFGKKLGALEVGAAADVIVVDYDPPTPMRAENSDGHCLFGMSGRDVVTTVIGGAVRMRERELVGVDAGALTAKYRAQAEDFWARINR